MAPGTLLCSAVMVVPLDVATWPSAVIPATSWMHAVLPGVLGTGMACGLYFRLIGRVGVSRAATTTYLVPLFGVTWAWLFLREPVTMIVSGVLILGSVIISQRSPGLATSEPVQDKLPVAGSRCPESCCRA